MKINSKNRHKYLLIVHIVFTTKYRKKILIGNIDTQLIEFIKIISLEKDFDILEINTDINHIHMLISYIPNITITSIVRYIKQKTTKFLWDNHSNILKTIFFREKTFWSDGYFVTSVGYNNSEVVSNYIKNQ